MRRARTKEERPDDARERDQKCGDARFAHAIDIGFEAGDEHQHEAADLGEQQERVGRRRSAEQRMCSMSKQPGPATTPTMQLTENGGNAKAGADRRRRSLPAGRRMAISSASCRVAGILSYLEPTRTGAAALILGFADESEERGEAGRA